MPESQQSGCLEVDPRNHHCCKYLSTGTFPRRWFYCFRTYAAAIDGCPSAAPATVHVRLHSKLLDSCLNTTLGPDQVGHIKIWPGTTSVITLFSSRTTSSLFRSCTVTSKSTGRSRQRNVYEGVGVKDPVFQVVVVLAKVLCAVFTA